MFNNRPKAPPGVGPVQASPSDSLAKEKLAVYVYEYLHHVGAQNAAAEFLKEINWQSTITLGDRPGFLQSWWCVFWDLYSAAPERRESFEHSQDAKAFHDLGFIQSGYPVVNGMNGPNAAQSPLAMAPGGPVEIGPGGMPVFPGGMHPAMQMRGGVMPNQPSPHSGASSSAGGMPPGAGFAPPGSGVRPRYMIRMSADAPNGPGGPPMMFAGDPQQMRMGGPAPAPGQTVMRLPPTQQRVGAPHPGFGYGMRPPMNVRHPPGQGWPPNTPGMHYTEPSPVASQFHVAHSMMPNGPGPGTPIIPSPHHDGHERYLMSVGGVPGSAMPSGFPMVGPDGGVVAPMGVVGAPMSSGGGGGPVGPAGAELLMNGGDPVDIKHEAGGAQGLNGGTPGPGAPPVGPAGVPPNGPGSAGTVGGPPSQPPLAAGPAADGMEFQPSGVNAFPPNESEEIAKIKHSMMEDFESKGHDLGFPTNAYE